VRVKAPETGIEKDMKWSDSWIYADMALTDFKNEEDMDRLAVEERLCSNYVDVYLTRSRLCETDYTETFCYELDSPGIESVVNLHLYVEEGEDLCFPTFIRGLPMFTVL
jgi:hypothetical protein